MNEKGEPAATRRDGFWLLDGMMPVDELQMILDLAEMPKGVDNYDTVGWLFMAQLSRIPWVSDKFQWKNLRFEVWIWTDTR